MIGNQFLEVPIKQNENGLLMCEITTDDGYDRSFRFDKRPQDKNFPETEVEIVEQGEDFITLRAKNYTHAVMLDGGYVFEDNCFTMLPGEQKNVSYRKAFEEQDSEITLTWLGK